MYGNSKPIIPRNGHTVVVGVVARISGCSNQKEISLEDQEAHAHAVIERMYQGPVEYRVIKTIGKGERLDRPELPEVEAMIRTGELDFLVCDDLGRMVRGAEATRLCGIAVDHGTRVLAPNDCIDTVEENWEQDVIAACRDHVTHNSHTSKRLKQKLMNRFVSFGGATAREIFGYIKPLGANSYNDWLKDPAATPIYREWWRILRETLNGEAVADYLNQQSISTGKYCRQKKWTGRMVLRITRNSLLKGMPGRGFRRTRKINEIGRRVSEKNPEGPQYRNCPHLIHVPPQEWDELNALLADKNACFKRKPVNGTDPLSRKAKKRTRFPGQHSRCWYCGRQYLWGANGVSENLMCSGARERRCWNSVGFSGALAANKLVEAIVNELYQLKGIDAQFRELVLQANQQDGKDLGQRWAKLKQAEEKHAREGMNLLAAIRKYGPQPMFEEELQQLEADKRNTAKERQELERLKERKLDLPESVEQLRHLFEGQFQKLARDSWEFGLLMRQLVPEFHVYLVRLCDGGHPLPRLRAKLSLASIVADAKYVPGLEEILTKEVTLDLFEPPQRERIRKESAQLRAQGLNQRQIAQRIAENPTQTAVQRALALEEQIRKLGLDSPYVFMLEPPTEYPKLRCHLNPKYRFEPEEGYSRLSL